MYIFLKVYKYKRYLYEIKFIIKNYKIINYIRIKSQRIDISIKNKITYKVYPASV